MTLKEAYPEFYVIARMKEASIGDHLTLSNNTPQWNDPFFRGAQDCEVHDFSDFYMT